jgi:hypothetical protein
VDIKDIDGKVYHVNRGSLIDWLRRNHDAHKKMTKEGMLAITEAGMQKWLDVVLAKKSPVYIVKIAEIKNGLERKEDQKDKEINIIGTQKITASSQMKSLILRAN